MAFFCAPVMAPQQRHAALQHKQLFKNQPPPRHLHIVHRGGLVDIFERKQRVGKLILPPDIRRNQIAGLVAAPQQQRLMDDLRQLPGTETRRQRVDRVKRNIAVGILHQRIGHLPGAVLSGDLAVKQIGFALLQPLGKEFVVEDGQVHHVAAVGHNGFVDRHALPDHAAADRTADHAAHTGGVARLQLCNRGANGEIEIRARIIVHRVPDAVDSKFAQQYGAFFTHAFDILHIHVTRAHRAFSFSELVRPGIKI